MLSPRHAGFRPGWSTLDQIRYLSQFITDGFNKRRSNCRTILDTIDFSKVFDSAWHPAVFHKLISVGLPSCFACWTQSFVSNRRACVVFQNHKSRSFSSLSRCFARIDCWPCTNLSFINDLPASLATSVSYSLYVGHLAI